MLKILFNALAVKRGGGVTATSNLVRGVTELRDPPHVAIAIRKNSAIQIPPSFPGAVYQLSESRAIAELQLGRLLYRTRPEWVVSTFGPAPLVTAPSGVRLAVNCAYSNLFHPELSFWDAKPFFLRHFALLKDKARLRGTLLADVVFLESEDLRQRADGLFGTAERTFVTLLPAVDSELLHLKREDRAAGHGTRILCFSGYHPNKNWERIPRITKAITAAGESVKFTFTAHASDPKVNKILEDINSIEGATAEAIGPIDRTQRLEFLTTFDALLLLSNLESFSNNFYEAWAAGLQLIVPRLGWAQVAGSSAVYVDPEDDFAAGLAIATAITEPIERLKRFREGRRLLLEMPTERERASTILEVLDL